MSVWSNLTFSAGKAGMSMLESVGYRWINGSNPIADVKFRSKPASRVVSARVAQQMLMQMTEAEVNKLFPRLQRQMENKLRQTVLEQTKDNDFAQLIQQGYNVTSSYGSITVSDGNGQITAYDYLTRKVPEALILSFKGEEPIEYTFPAPVKEESYTIEKSNLFKSLLEAHTTINHTKIYDYSKGVSIMTNDVVHIDLSPQVSLSSSKNLILTTVQGRDFTRKELIGNGDLNFNVNGAIVSDIPGQYPAMAVERLVKIAQHKGIVNVHHFVFNQLNVHKIIIKDFSLGTQEYKNIQPYSFSCVAVETDDITIQNDTIGRINQDIQLSPMNAWYQLILNNKFTEIVAGAAADAANSAIGKGLDIESMVTNL